MYEPDADMIFNYLMVSALANSSDIIEKRNLKATGGMYTLDNFQDWNFRLHIKF